ncbi:Uma2 family endonuclease [Leptolyngbya sp. BC1307]|uniref:Uma2 family endonuclease n=1 Tax=Leptolyngbya sp. BC1307 TaxID=2029589 RepID=UPI000EFAEE99|nr:Uma2 family endonuclease [Leptolyngbya sp. BC1307]
MVMLSTQASELDLDNFDGQLTQTVVLSHISWQTYQAVLADMGDHRAARVAYNQGVLTLKVPSKFHEIVNRLLARIVATLTEELGLEVINVGSTTLERDDLEKGAEPDTGFYIQNAYRLEGLDPEIPPDLPPDLVIEVDITSPSNQRMAIYQTLGISEVWRYTKRQGLEIYQLQANDYAKTETSVALPQLTADRLNDFLTLRQTQGENQVIRAVRSWIQQV